MSVGTVHVSFTFHFHFMFPALEFIQQTGWVQLCITAESKTSVSFSMAHWFSETIGRCRLAFLTQDVCKKKGVTVFFLPFLPYLWKSKSQTIEIEPTSPWKEQTWYIVHFFRPSYICNSYAFCRALVQNIHKFAYLKHNFHEKVLLLSPSFRILSLVRCLQRKNKPCSAALFHFEFLWSTFQTNFYLEAELIYEYISHGKLMSLHRLLRV